MRGPSTPASASSSVGLSPYAARQASFSAGCSDRWTCSGVLAAHAATVLIWSWGTARTLWIAAPTRSSSNAATRSAHASAEPSLNRRCTPSAGWPIPAVR